MSVLFSAEQDLVHAHERRPHCEKYDRKTAKSCRCTVYLKTVDRRKMIAKEEKIALVAVVAVKEEWKAPGEVSKKRRLAACFLLTLGSKRAFLHTLRASFEAFQSDGSFIYAMMGGER